MFASCQLASSLVRWFVSCSAVAMEDGGLAGLANELEKCTLVRRRFQQELPWLQWPIPPCTIDPEEEKEPGHPICTKSLELNSDAVRILMEFLHGEFCNIDCLVIEAWLSFYQTMTHRIHTNFSVANIYIYIMMLYCCTDR